MMIRSVALACVLATGAAEAQSYDPTVYTKATAQRSFKADRKPLVAGQVVELPFDLQPTATVFNAGHRLRVTIAGADADNTERPPVHGRPTITVYRGPEHPSAIRLPVVR